MLFVGDHALVTFYFRHLFVVLQQKEYYSICSENYANINIFGNIYLSIYISSTLKLHRLSRSLMWYDIISRKKLENVKRAKEKVHGNMKSVYVKSSMLSFPIIRRSITYIPTFISIE